MSLTCTAPAFHRFTSHFFVQNTLDTYHFLISPQQTTIGSLLTYVRSGDMVNVHSLRRRAAEAIEVIAHGDQNSSKVVGRAIEEIDLPEGATIGAILRKTDKSKRVIIAHDDTVIESGDHVIVFMVDRKQTKYVEKLFQVGFSFF